MLTGLNLGLTIGNEYPEFWAPGAWTYCSGGSVNQFVALVESLATKWVVTDVRIQQPKFCKLEK